MSFVLMKIGYTRIITGGDYRMGPNGYPWRYWTGIGWRSDRRYAVRFAFRRWAEAIQKVLADPKAGIVRSKRS